MSVSSPSNQTAYRDVNVLRWMTGLSLSLLGDSVFFIALAWTAAQIASPTVAGLIVAAGAVPRAGLMLFGGALADRSGPRKSALFSDAARTLVMLAVAGVLLLQQPSVSALLVLAMIFGVIDAIFIPAVGAMPSVLVAPSNLSQITAMRQVVYRGTAIVGAPLAGWLIASQGLTVVYLACAGLFACSTVALAATRVRRRLPTAGSAKVTSRRREHSRTEEALRETDVAKPNPASASNLLTEVWAGLRYVRSHALLVPLLLLTAVTELGFSGAMNVGLPLLADASEWGPQGVGWMLGAWGAAAAIASVVLTVTRSPRHAGLIGICCQPLMGLSLAAIPLANDLSIAVAAAALLGLSSGIAAPIFGALTLAAAAEDQVGRVVSVASLASLGGIPLAYAATGAMVDLLGPSAPFLIGGLLITISGLIAFTSRPLRTAQVDDRHNDTGCASA